MRGALIVIAVCLCCMAFGWWLPILAVLVVAGLVIGLGGVLVGTGMHFLWRKLCGR